MAKNGTLAKSQELQQRFHNTTKQLRLESISEIVSATAVRWVVKCARLACGDTMAASD
jgi:hypothetical protein